MAAPVDQWWATDGAVFPTLRKMAGRLLPMPVHAAACERVWSAVGRIYRAQRQRMGIASLNEQLFTMWNSHFERSGSDEPAAKKRRGTSAGPAAGGAEPEPAAAAGAASSPEKTTPAPWGPFQGIVDEAAEARHLVDELLDE